ncbi:MAG: hypothetical protein ACHQNE_03135, partial [Candidatus Kapaibacterium sp.]
TLPDSLPLAGEFLQAAVVSSPNVTLKWTTASGGGGLAGWLLAGNLGTTPGVNYIGTNDSEAFEIHVFNNGDSSGGNQRVMRFEPGEDAPNIIGGFKNNTINQTISSVGVDGSVILGGGDEIVADTISSSYSTIAGGLWNLIESGRLQVTGYSSGENASSFIGGGWHNSIDASVDSSAWEMSENVISGGGNNHIERSGHSVIAGGGANFIGQNLLSGDILGGQNDTIESSLSTIAGGENNFVDTSADHAVISGGKYNLIQGGPLSNVIGGDANVTSTFGTIAGGEGNTIKRIGTFANGHSFIGGGQENIAQAEFDVIGGGRGNIMHVDTFRSGFNMIGGGDSNFVGYGSYDNTIGGGKLNWVANAYGTVGGGIGNLLNGPASLNTIGGGYFNEIGGDSSINAGYIWKSTIGGGDSNMIRQFASFSTISGGSHNSIDSGALFNSVGGGRGNKIDSVSLAATIAGGDSLIARGYGQFVTGYNNIPSGPVKKGTSYIGLDSIQFMVGNGDDANHRSNSIEASYGGHLTLHDTLRSQRAMVAGSGYVDNQIDAWAIVDSTRGVLETDSSTTPGALGHFQGFGIVADGVNPISLIYLFHLNETDNHGNLVTYSAGSVVVTMITDDPNIPSGCFIPVVTRIRKDGHFSVVIHDAQHGCVNVKRAFTLHVVARPM